MKRYTIVVDSREKIPLLFPTSLKLLSPAKLPQTLTPRIVEITTVKERLETGDYLLQSDREGTIIERKGSLSECATNCLTRDRRRFISALDRLAERAANPCVLVEGHPSTFLRTPLRLGDRKVEPGLALDAFQRVCLERSITPIFIGSSTRPQRQAIGEYVARLLLNSHLTTPIPEFAHAADPRTQDAQP